ncbi:hypothetical protein [Desulfotomaculum sp. 1211_IL3151]|uniref:hypothetical protein n=1 Tax=Desulfotomaculum sp. 1211_IL3151 TaxID=3084055 RepID=UPI002FDA3903
MINIKNNFFDLMVKVMEKNDSAMLRWFVLLFYLTIAIYLFYIVLKATFYSFA